MGGDGDGGDGGGGGGGDGGGFDVAQVAVHVLAQKQVGFAGILAEMSRHLLLPANLAANIWVALAKEEPLRNLLIIN